MHHHSKHPKHAVAMYSSGAKSYGVLLLNDEEFQLKCVKFMSEPLESISYHPKWLTFHIWIMDF